MIGNGWYDKEFIERWTNAPKPVDASSRVWDLIVEECAKYPPEVAQEITGVPAEQIVATSRLLWEQRPVAFYTWSGLEQHSNATQTVRAIGQLYALTGCVDAPGGNVLFTPVPTNPACGHVRSDPPGSSSSPARTSTARRSTASLTEPGRWSTSAAT